MVNRRLFFNELLEQRLTGVCLWENFQRKGQRIYEITGKQFIFPVSANYPPEIRKFEIRYLDERKTGYKTIEEMAQDYVATSGDLMALGELIATKK